MLRWTCCVVALIASGCCAGTDRSCEAWDDGYAGIVSGTTEGMVGHSEAAARLFVNPLASAAPNAQDKSYERTRELVSTAFPAASEAVRLEISGLEYECVWLARTNHTVKALVTRGGRVSLKEVPWVRWTRLRELIEKEWSKERLQSDVAPGVLDGVAYYVSICLGGRSAQFALYGLSEDLWDSYRSDDLVVSPKYSRERDIVRVLLGFLRE